MNGTSTRSRGVKVENGDATVDGSGGMKDEHENNKNNHNDNKDGSVQDDRDGSGEPSSASRSKRRRMATGLDTSLILSEDRSKRRKTPTPEQHTGGDNVKEDPLDPRDPARAKKLGYVLYNQILEQTDSEGQSMSEPFVKLPSKRQLPDYYETIKHPMSLEMVQQKLDSSAYETLKDVTADLTQIFTNAKRYNIKESLIFIYAKKYHKMIKDYYTEITTAAENASEGEDEDDEEGDPTPARSARPSASASAPAMTAEPSSQGVKADDEDVTMGEGGGGPSNASMDGDSIADRSYMSSGHAASMGQGEGRYTTGRKRGSYMKDGPTVYKLIKPVLRAIKDARSKDGTGRDISGIFMELPDRRDLPDYFQAIQHPISLGEIEQKMVARLYQTIDQFFQDIALMCSNAFTYNEDASEVFLDARQIKDIADAHYGAIKERLVREEAQRSRDRASNVTPVRYGVSAPGPSVDTSYPSVPYSSYNNSPMGSAGIHNAYPSPSPANFRATPTGPGSYLPALPKGVVTEDVVASLDKYPQYEQQAWVNSLQPQAMQMYRQMVSMNEARKRVSMTPAGPSTAAPSTYQAQGAGIEAPSRGYQMTDLPSAARPSAFPDRQAPPPPTVKYLDFAFSSRDQPPEQRQALRLHNMRGVVTHAVILGSETTEVDLTAYIAKSSHSKPNSSPKDAAGAGANGTSTETDSTPEVSLRVNGNPSSLPRYVYDDEKKEKPAGMKWTIMVPTGRAEMKVEVVATKPGALAETTAIYINRQL